MVLALLSICPIVIHLLDQLSVVIKLYAYFDHFCGLQTSENTPGKFNKHSYVVCMNNVRIQSMW